MSDIESTESTDTSESTVDQLPIPFVSSLQSEDGSVAEITQIILPKRRQPKWQGILRPRRPIVDGYFTAGARVNEENARDLEKEPSPFHYPADVEAFAYKVLNKEWRNDERLKELQQKYFERSCRKDGQKKDLLNRLYVKETTKVATRTATDINPEYFKIVQGRPIADKLDTRQYIQSIRDSLRTNIVIGYREDDIALIDETLVLEQTAIDIVKENLQSYINTFEEFLLEDHSTAMKVLKDAEDISKRTYDKYLEHAAIAQKVSSLNSSLYNMEEKWRLCKTYQKFLYAISPMSWKIQQGPTTRRTSIYVMQRPTDEFVFGGYRSSILRKGISVEDIIHEFREETLFDQPPQLYFTKPEELMDVFRFMEIQNLNALLHSEELAEPLERVSEGLKASVDTFDKHMKNLQEVIDILEKGILWEEGRVIYLEEQIKDLVDNDFKNLLICEEVLNLGVIVEDIYESRIGPNDANIDMVGMMTAIEELYRRELLCLDKIPSKELALLEGAYYEEELLIMRLAEKATKQFEELGRITHNLKKAYEPPKERRRDREPKKRSPPVNPPKKVQLPARSLTRREEDYLEFFTQFCIYTDDLKDYGIDTTAGAEEKALSVLPEVPPSPDIRDSFNTN